jgi:GTP cyclohydrolase II
MKNFGIYLYSTATVPLASGIFEISVYRTSDDASEAVVISQGIIGGARNLFVRIHSECFTGEALASLKCDCRFQLEYALEQIAGEQRGLVIYLRQEGRGIGLGDKIRAYHLQNSGLDTIAANHALGLASDLRSFALAAKILLHLDIDEVRLNSNNLEKRAALEDEGLIVQALIPSLAPVTEFNEAYLATKYHKMGHQLGALFSP